MDNKKELSNSINIYFLQYKKINTKTNKSTVNVNKGPPVFFLSNLGVGHVPGAAAGRRNFQHRDPVPVQGRDVLPRYELGMQSHLRKTGYFV